MNRRWGSRLSRECLDMHSQKGLNLFELKKYVHFLKLRHFIEYYNFYVVIPHMPFLHALLKMKKWKFEHHDGFEFVG